MAHALSTGDTYTAFLDRWQKSEAAERANYVLFLTELCEVLDLPRPEPTASDERANTYVFEKAVTFHNVDGSVARGRIDLYRKGHFVLEAKQGSNAPAFQLRVSRRRVHSHQSRPASRNPSSRYRHPQHSRLG